MDFHYSTLTLVVVALFLPGEGSPNVNLIATDENGKQTDHFSPGSTVNLNCSYDVKPLYLNFYNGTDKNIFVWNFMTGKGSIGRGFEKVVKSNASGDGWISIDFEVPYCYKDEVIKCSVLDQAAENHENKREFPVGMMNKPVMYHDNKKLSCGQELQLPSGELHQFTCQVSLISPEANISLSGCEHSGPLVSMNDTSICLWNQSSTVNCSISASTYINCSTSNDIDQESCHIHVKIQEGECYTTCAHEADPDEKIVIGGNKSIGCYIEKEGHSGNITYKWYKDGREIIPTVGGKYQLLTRWKLLVHGIQKEDEGVYTCRIRNRDGLGNINAAYMFTIAWSPRLDGPDRHVIIGDDIQLRCDVTHLNEKITKLQWYLDGNAIGDAITDPTYKDFLYNINNVQHNDKGLYECEVTGQAETGSDTYLLKVYCEC